MKTKLKMVIALTGLYCAVSFTINGQTSAWSAGTGTLNTVTSPTTGLPTRVSIAGTNAAPTTSTVTPGGVLSVGSPSTNLVLQSGVYATGSIPTSYSWIQSRNQTTTDVLTLKLNPLGGEVSVGVAAGAGGVLRMNDNKIYLRGSSDVNHGLAYDAFGGGVNGAVLFGYNGGALASTNGGNKITMKWDEQGYVNVPNNFEVGPIAVRSSSILAQYWATNKVAAMYITSRCTSNYNYGIKLDVDQGLTKALAVLNSATGAENFQVYGDGTVFAREVNVELGTFSHPDYVFAKNYKLMPLTELETYLASNKHLPNVPSEAEVIAKNGINLGEMSEKQLEKIEELTLYIIELNKKMEEQNKRITELENSGKK